MIASLSRLGLGPSLALVAGAALAALAGCSPAASHEGTASVRFAVSSPLGERPIGDRSIFSRVRVNEVRVLSDRVNLREPVLMGADSGDATITFAHRQREGETITMAPKSLETRAAIPHAYPAQRHGTAPAFLADGPSTVVLADGSSLSFWTDEETSSVLVQAFDPNGAWRGSSETISPDGMSVFGAPHAVTPDGRNVVVAFFVSEGERFQLVAASLERAR